MTNFPRHDRFDSLFFYTTDMSLLLGHSWQKSLTNTKLAQSFYHDTIGTILLPCYKWHNPITLTQLVKSFYLAESFNLGWHNGLTLLQLAQPFYLDTIGLILLSLHGWQNHFN